MEHKAFEAISLVSNPFLSKASIKTCYAASSCGAMIVADTKVLTLRLENGGKKDEEEFIANCVFVSRTSHKPQGSPALLRKN